MENKNQHFLHVLLSFENTLTHIALAGHISNQVHTSEVVHFPKKETLKFEFEADQNERSSLDKNSSAYLLCRR